MATPGPHVLWAVHASDVWGDHHATVTLSDRTIAGRRIDRPPGRRCLRATADPGAGERDPRVVPQRLPGALFERPSGRNRSAAMPEGQHGGTVARLPVGRG